MKDDSRVSLDPHVFNLNNIFSPEGKILFSFSRQDASRPVDGKGARLPLHIQLIKSDSGEEVCKKRRFLLRPAHVSGHLEMARV